MKIRGKAKARGGVTTVKVLIKHPMLSYLEAKKKGKEANFILYVKAEHNGEIVYEANTSQFLSKNPYFKFKFSGGKKGEEVKISAVDLKGERKSKVLKIK